MQKGRYTGTVDCALMCGSLLLAFASAGRAVGDQTVQADLSEAASHLRSLSPFDVWQDHPGECIRDDDEHVADRYVLDRLAASNYSSASLIQLLMDPSPRVRTLAAVLLFKKEDPQLIPAIESLATDITASFPALVQWSAIIAPPKARLQTVADFTRAFVGSYVNGSQVFPFANGNPTFSDYWGPRKNRSHCFSWLRVKYLGAAGLSIPLDGKAQARVALFRKELGKMSDVDRDLYLIWLQSTLTEPDLAAETDISAAVQHLGRENVLAIAEGTPPSSDPDLQPQDSLGRYQRVAAIVLDHSGGVLRGSDVARLRTVVERENKRLAAQGGGETCVSGSYAAAIARLSDKQPK